ncbi:MAG: hypothetical protein K2M71_05760, partial [Duncaniella sp.]|nr:hypothetical protein [Duncaniella sp.]
LGPDTFRFYSTMGKGIVTHVTTDGGKTVSREKEVATPVSLSRCYVIADARPELKLVMFSNPVVDGRESLTEGSRNMYTLNDIFEK